VQVYGRSGASAIPQSAAVCVRPNDIRLAAAAPDARAGALPKNTYLAEVIYASFEGTQVHYRARTDAGTIWDIVSPNVEGAVPIGNRIVVQIDEERVLILPRSRELAGLTPE
jgi:ABC-type Fe3+/spermidine/putrescine transport system ATPase subunit